MQLRGRKTLSSTVYLRLFVNGTSALRTVGDCLSLPYFIRFVEKALRVYVRKAFYVFLLLVPTVFRVFEGYDFGFEEVIIQIGDIRDEREALQAARGKHCV